MKSAVVKTKALLSCSVITGRLFVLVFLVEGDTRAGYDPLRHPISSPSATTVGRRRRCRLRGAATNIRSHDL